MYVLPTPGAAPKKIVSLPRAARRLLFAHAREQLVGIRPLFGHRATSPHALALRAIQREVQLDDVDPRLAEHAEGAALACGSSTSARTFASSRPRAFATRWTW